MSHFTRKLDEAYIYVFGHVLWYMLTVWLIIWVMVLDNDTIATKFSWGTGGELRHHRWKSVNLYKGWLVHSTGYWRVALGFRDRSIMGFKVFLWYYYIDNIIFLLLLEKLCFWITNYAWILKWKKWFHKWVFVFLLGVNWPPFLKKLFSQVTCEIFWRWSGIEPWIALCIPLWRILEMVRKN